MPAATIALLVLGLAPSFQPDPVKSPPKEAVVVRLRALDSGQAGKEFHELVQKAREDKAPALVLVVEGDLPWRSDVLRDALVDLKEARVPSAVFVGPGSPARPAGWGASVLGIAADHWGSPVANFPIEVRPDTEERALAAEKVDWPAVEADLRDLLAPHIARWGWFPGSLDVLMFPMEAWWVVRVKGPVFEEYRSLSRGEKPAVAANERALEVCKASPARGFVPFTVGVWSLGGRGDKGQPDPSRTWEDLCRGRKIKAPARAGETTTSSVPEVRAGVEKALEQVKGFREQVEAGVGEAEKKGTPPQQAARAGARERQRIRGAETALKAVEALLDRFPEVQRTTPPGVTTVNAKPGTNPAKWRTLVQGHRDALAKLEARAAALEEKGK
jgi:hypothetical protein